MSAIAGIYLLDGRTVGGEDLLPVVNALAHRGPDGQNSWIKGGVGLTHSMLHTTPESLNEHMPCRRGSLAITADARIDNRAELLAVLTPEPNQPEPITDSDLILLAYRRWGEDCPERLLGDFVFAIWDDDKHQLFCARDHFGVKTLYYAFDHGKRFIFATEIKALFSFGGVSDELDELKIADFMLESFEDKARTFYTHIKRLTPASAMMVGRNGVRHREFWNLEPKGEIRLRSDEEYAEAFRSLFVEAVACRLRSAFPVGSMLSGGLDSSSIACVAHDLSPPEKRPCLHTFSIVFDQVKQSDERHYMNKVLDQKSFVPHFLLGDELTPFDDLDRVLWFQDEPFYAPNLFLTRRAWRAANDSGVRVLLDGLLGDNVVSHGVEHLNELARRWRWLHLANELKQLIARSGTDVSVFKPLGRYILQQGLKPYAPEVALRLWRQLRGMPTIPVENRCAVFADDYVVRTGLSQRLTDEYFRSRTVRSARQAHCDTLTGGMIQTALETYSNGCGEFGIETRFPFIDKRLVEFCVALPGAQKIGGGFTRMILRRGLRDYLPEEVRWRSDKGDLGWSFIRGFDARRGFAAAELTEARDLLHTFFAPDGIQSILIRLESGRMTPDQLMEFFLVVVFSAWLRRHWSRRDS